MSDLRGGQAVEQWCRWRRLLLLVCHFWTKLVACKLVVLQTCLVQTAWVMSARTHFRLLAVPRTPAFFLHCTFATACQIRKAAIGTRTRFA